MEGLPQVAGVLLMAETLGPLGLQILTDGAPMGNIQQLMAPADTQNWALALCHLLDPLEFKAILLAVGAGNPSHGLLTIEAVSYTHLEDDWRALLHSPA